MDNDLDFDLDFEEEELVEEDTDIDIIEASSIKADTSNDRYLYIITDAKKPMMLKYFRQYGVDASDVYDEVTEINDLVVLTSKSIDVVIIDTGKGKFRSGKFLWDIIDILGIASDKLRFHVFQYNNNIHRKFKAAGLEESSNIKWYKYTTTRNVVAVMLSEMVKYGYDKYTEENSITTEEFMRYKGSPCYIEGKEMLVTVSTDTKLHKKYDMLNRMIDSDYEELEKYEVNI